MAAYFTKLAQYPKEFSVCKKAGCQFIQRRRLHVRRKVKRYDEGKSFEERTAELKQEAEKKILKNNIGFPLKKFRHYVDPDISNEVVKVSWDYEDKLKSRLDLNKVREVWWKEKGPEHAYTLAEHYGIYRDLFDHSYFHPKIFMKILYNTNERVCPVYLGNKLTPFETSVSPNIIFNRDDPDKLFTLVMTSPDGNLQDNNKEFLHWMIGNISGNDVKKGEIICDYMKPHPPRGTGLSRYVFILYEQSQKMDYANIQRPEKCMSLSERTFQTYEFYKERQDLLTPASISFFQAEWDPSVQGYFRNILGLKDPYFKFINPPFYHPVQQKYPNKEPFNIYLDRYRNIQDVKEEVLREKLKNLDPFKAEEPRKTFPLIHLDHKKATWQKLRDKHIALRRHQWKGMN